MFQVFVQILLNMNLSMNQTPLMFLLCVRQTLMAQLIRAISVRGYFPLIRKHSVTHMHAFYVKEGLPFGQDLSLDISVDSYLCFGLALQGCHTS